MLFLIIISCIVFLGAYFYALFTPKINIKEGSGLYIYDKDLDAFYEGNGTSQWVSLDEVSPYFIDAITSVEDKRFYHHFGFDFLRIIRAIETNLLTKSKSEGASTITQQYARNIYLTMEKTWKRKINEAWLAFELEVHYNKKTILEGYLNTINYGGVFGIEAASKYYFGKSAKDLNLAESSILAGIPKSPTNYSPIDNYEMSKKRQKVVLVSMFKNNKISDKDKNMAYNQELTFIGKKDKNDLATINYYKDAVIRELKTIKSIPKEMLEMGGIKIYTSLDINAQEILEKKVNENISKPDMQVSSIMIEPKTGKIIALIGGVDYGISQFNRAIQSKRQVGSTMKPFLYYEALENGFTASSSFASEPTTFTFSNNKTYAPNNYGDIYGHRQIPLSLALAYSDNIFAIKTHLFLGENTLVDIAKRVGIQKSLSPLPSLPLGTDELTMIDLLSGYNTLANEGSKVSLHTILRVDDMSGNTIYTYNEVDDKVLNKSLVYILNDLLTGTYDYMLTDYNTPSCTYLAPRLSKKYAMKSGSTDGDSWMIGYNKDMLMAVWTGYDNNTKLEVNDYRITKNIFVDTAEDYLKEKTLEETWYKIPDNVVGVLVNPITGNLATNSDNKKKILYYIKGTEPFVSSNDLEKAFKQSN